MTDENKGWDPEHLKIMTADNAVKCPDHLKGEVVTMELRQKGGEIFYGCSKFPDCLTTHRAFQEGSMVGAPVGQPASRAIRSLRSQVYTLADARFNLKDEAGKKKFALWCARKLRVSTKAAYLTKMNQGQLERLVPLLEANVK